MAQSLTANDHVVLVRADLSPDDGDRVLRKSPQVDHLALLGNLDKGSTVGLANGNELATIWGRPAPRGRSLAAVAAQGRMAAEMIQVHLLESVWGYL